ncbi:MAG: ABC transporter permease [Deltaproteobacteria bacterium]|nr:ABC transporter permease [Deltaproteobacteria bacterium]MCZ6906799.1 ABC transporter permease [Deltaproteobacteria bacterium]
MKGLKIFGKENALRIFSLMLGLGAWEIASRLSNTPLVPGPQRVLTTLVRAFGTEGIPDDPTQALGGALLSAFVPMFVAYILATVTGISLGILMGINRKMERLLDPFINALYAAPISALVPVMIFWLGLGFTARVVVIYLFAVFVIIVNTLQGVKHTPGDFVELARSFGASRRYIISHIVIPNAIPYIMVGLRLGIGRAVRGVVVSELIISVTGIGIIISNYSAFFRIDGILAVAVAIMIVGMLLTGLVVLLENLLAPWKKKGTAFQE